MSYYEIFFGWLLKPITAPLEWFFKHRCVLDRDGCCKHEYCGTGKEGVEGWGQSNERWVRRSPLPPTPPKGPPPVPKPYSQHLSQRQVNDMLLEAYVRTQRAFRVPPRRRGDAWPWAYRYKDGYTTNVKLVEKEYRRVSP